MFLYCRNPLKDLIVFESGLSCHVEAIQEVMRALHEEQAIFYKPVLAVIKGGKA